MIGREKPREKREGTREIGRHRDREEVSEREKRREEMKKNGVPV